MNRPEHQSEKYPTDDIAEQLAAFDDSVQRGSQSSLTTDLDTSTAELQSTILRLERHWPRSNRLDESTSPRSSGEPLRVGRFEIQQEIGRGGFGIVFLALDPQLNRKVALKVPRPESLLDSERQQRFISEAEAAASLDHPAIMPIYEANHAGPTPYIASAYCEGPDLKQWLSVHKQAKDWQLAASLVATLAEGVHHAHCKGVYHRDIKPSNVLLARRDSASIHAVDEAIDPELGQYEPRLTDFGLAKFAESNMRDTQSNLVMGTPLYMAPEQLEGTVDKQCLAAVDVYALGSILFEILTGQPPFDGSTYIGLMAKLRNAKPPQLRKTRPDCPVDLDYICAKCLEKSPQLRYQSTAQLAEHLHGCLAGQPVRARVLKKRTRFLIGTTLAVAMVLSFAFLAAGIFFKVDTKDSTLVVKVSGNDFATSVQGEKVSIKNTETNEIVTVDLDSPEERKAVEPGSYFVLETASGLTTETNRFSIRSGETAIVEVWLEPRTKDRQSAAKSNATSGTARMGAVSPQTSANHVQDSSSPRLMIFAPNYSLEELHDLKNLFLSSTTQAEVLTVDSIAGTSVNDSAVLIVVMNQEAFLDIGEYHPEDLMARKIVGIGYGAAKLFGKMGLRISAGMCIHGARESPSILLTNNLTQSSEQMENPFYLFTPRTLDQSGYHSELLFGLNVGDKSRASHQSVEVLGVLTENHKYAPIARQGNHVLVGVDASVENWSPPLRELVRTIATKIGRREFNSMSQLSEVKSTSVNSSFLSFSPPPDQISLAAARNAILPVNQERSDRIDDSMAIYIGYGSEYGNGRILEVDGNGKLIGTVSLPAAPHALTCVDGRLAAALPQHRPSVVMLSHTGGIEELPLDDEALPSVTGLSTAGLSNSLIVADNQVNLLARLEVNQTLEPEVILRLTDDKDFHQHASLAMSSDGYLLYSGSDHNRVYRILLNENIELGEPILPSYARLAADPSSSRWVAALDDELVIFDGSQETARFSYPAKRKAWYDLVAFAPDGSLIISLHTGFAFEVFQVNLADQEFQNLFTLDLDRVKSLTIGPRMNWPMQ